MTDRIEITALGGLGEFGMNCMHYACGGSRILVDCGVMFPRADHPGVDFVIPDFAFLRERLPDAIVATHGHEDHIGGIPFLLQARLSWGERRPLPIYGTRFTLGLIRRRLEEHELIGAVDFNVLSPGERVELGAFGAEAIHVNHSIPGAFALALTTPLGVLIHTADWRIDPEPINEPFIDLGRLAELGRSGVLAVLGDSTNSETDGSNISEAAVRREFEDVFDLAPGRILLTQFSSNIWRLQSVFDAAYATGRRVLTVGRSLERNLALARELGYLRLRSDALVLRTADLAHTPDDEVVIVAGGSQGEPYSSLTRIAFGEHPDVSVQPGDWVIYSSRRIPGNERAIRSVIDALHQRGADVLLPGKRQLHTSGHAAREELKLLLSILKPRFFMPVHGDMRQLVKHAELASQLGIEKVVTFTDGETLGVDDHGVQRLADTPMASIYVVGSGVGTVNGETLRQRRQVGFTGVVVVTVVMDAHNRTVCGPDVRTYGVVDDDDEIVTDARLAAAAAIAELDGHDDDAIAEAIRLATRRVFRVATERKPFVMPVVLRVGAEATSS